MSTITTLSAAITAMPGAASLPMANMVSGHVSPVTTNTSYQTAKPIKAAVWTEKMAKNSLRHLSGTLHIETRRSGSGVDIAGRIANLLR